jgi:predicted nucleic acid-binding protein
VSRAVLDTSVLIAREQGRSLEQPLPNDVAISVVSIAELELGVLMARDATTRGQRLRTLTEVRSITGTLPIDERTASAYAQLAANVIGEGRKDAEVWTQDADFSDFADAVPVVRV